MQQTTAPARCQSVQKVWLALWQQHTARRTKLQLVAIAVFSIGLLTIALESVTLGGAMRHSVGLVQFAWHRVAARDSGTSTDSLTATPSPPEFFVSEDSRMCYYTRDIGLVTEIRSARIMFCERPTGSSTHRTQVSIIDLNDRGLNLRAMTFARDLSLDFTNVSIHRPIASIAQDGGSHNPRFNWDPSMVSCGCDELKAFADETATAGSGDKPTPLRLWDPQFAGTPEAYDEPSSVCASSPPPQRQESVSPSPVVHIDEKTILISRRDDHNPFFQISNALNAWLLMRAFNWRREETRVVHMDGGYASHVDALHHALLSSPSTIPLLRGREDLVGNRVQFTNDVVVLPNEATGPMMQHLNDDEPCHDSHLFKSFRAEALEAMHVDELAVDTSRQITVTIVSRRNYGGRRVQRRWLNEDEVVTAMQRKYSDYHGVPITIQSVDFVDLTLEQQMETVLKSDVIIGMHGAGMVNVLWTKPETLVVEIFPKKRKRWGYRNLCQFVGCDWHEFRGGNDTGKGDNASDKTIPVDLWEAFFDPLFSGYLTKLATVKRTVSVDEQRQRLRVN